MCECLLLNVDKCKIICPCSHADKLELVCEIKRVKSATLNCGHQIKLDFRKLGPE